jgi:hypothetical protein
VKPIPTLGLTTGWSPEEDTGYGYHLISRPRLLDSELPISESIGWNPNRFWYVQLTGGVVYHVIHDLPASRCDAGHVHGGAYDTNKVLQIQITTRHGRSADWIRDRQGHGRTFQIVYYKANNDIRLAPLTYPMEWR